MVKDRDGKSMRKMRNAQFIEINNEPNTQTNHGPNKATRKSIISKTDDQ